MDKPPNSHHKFDTTKHWQNFIVREFHTIEKIRKKKKREKGIEFFYIWTFLDQYSRIITT